MKYIALLFVGIIFGNLIYFWDIPVWQGMCLVVLGLLTSDLYEALSD